MTEAPRDIAILVDGVGKTFKLFSDARQMVAHQLGLRDLPFLRQPPIPEFTALDDINFTLARGERIGLIGRNGAGKTTLLKLITRSLAPTRGTVEVNGTLQALMQTGIGFHPEFTGRQNIDATLQYFGLHGEAYQAAMDDVIRFVELGKYLDQPYSTYSLGMQSRTQFAVATAFRPDILLIDEILGAGDGYFAAKSADRMKKLIGSGCTMILVSHSAVTIEMFCERVIWLRDGRIHRDGPAKPVLAEYEQEMETLAQAGAGVRAEAVDNAGPFSLPVSLRTDFVREHVLAAEPVAGNCQPVVPDGATDSATRRLVGAPGLSISGVRFSLADNQERGLEVGDRIQISADLVSENPGRKHLRLSLLIYTLSGERLARASGLVDVDFEKDGKAVIDGEITQILLGVGHYVVSLLVEDAAFPEQSEEARYDLWSQCGSLNYAPSNESDPPKLHLDGWVHQGDSAPARVRIHGMG
ncbi:MAG: ATP-binding cassette domain-containing protein [Rhizobiales bacterium]|nr:ATP-binding cassette domain-containing protein [Hyphomicrobiales bacterium]